MWELYTVYHGLKKEYSGHEVVDHGKKRLKRRRKKKIPAVRPGF